MTKSPPINWLLGIVAICFVCNVCGYGGLLLPPFYLLVGWVRYLVRFPGGAFLALAGVAALAMLLTTLGAQLVGQRYWRDPPWRWRRSLGIGVIVGLMPIVGVLANDGLFHLWQFTIHDPPIHEYHIAPRTVSVNNVKQIGFAVHAYHDSLTHLPIGGTFDTQGRGMHGWQTIILPYVDQAPLFQKIDLKQPWNTPANAQPMATELSVFMHPRNNPTSRDGFGLSHYAGNVHVLGPMKMKLGDITDGSENTILTGEVTSNFKPWGSPTNWRDPGLGLHTHPDGFGGPSLGVTVIGFADGTVRTVRNDVSPDILKALSTPRGGENVGVEQLDR